MVEKGGTCPSRVRRRMRCCWRMERAREMICDDVGAVLLFSLISLFPLFRHELLLFMESGWLGTITADARSRCISCTTLKAKRGRLKNPSRIDLVQSRRPVRPDSACRVGRGCKSGSRKKWELVLLSRRVGV